MLMKYEIKCLQLIWKKKYCAWIIFEDKSVVPCVEMPIKANNCFNGVLMFVLEITFSDATKTIFENNTGQ